MFENAVILVTGGTGSWGGELVRQLLKLAPRQVVVYSRNESAQVKMRWELQDPRLSFCIGDVRDREALMRACKGVDYIFHLAALKHVDICEEQPYEALKTNVGGTQHVIEAAIANGVCKVINISTDKAADAVNFYGMTKALAEKLITHANEQTVSTRFVNVRGGNILGSSGSVLHLFRDQICQGQSIRVTDCRMVRYFMTPQMATSLLLTAAERGIGGETFILRMPACKITDLAQALHIVDDVQTMQLREVGCRPGEKLYEILLSPYECLNAVVSDEHYVVVLPSAGHPALLRHYADCPRFADQVVPEESALLSIDEICKLLLASGLAQSAPKSVRGGSR